MLGTHVCIHKWEGVYWKDWGGTRLEGEAPEEVHSTPLNKRSPKRISVRELLRENWTDWWIHILHSIACGTVTPKASHWQLQQRAVREIRPGETMHFRKMLGLSMRKIYPCGCIQSVSSTVCQESLAALHEHVQFKSSNCIPADSIHFKVTHSHL